jgi:thiamine biosynthesis lipoprotein
MTAKFAVRFKALGGVNEVQLHTSDPSRAQRAGKAIVDETKRIETAFSRFLDGSIVSRINAAAGKHAVRVDEETARLLNFAAACFEDSGGLFDITSGALQKVWDFKSPGLPSSAALKHALSLVGWHRVEWHAPYIYLPLHGMSLDFGGIGKEYAVDRASNILREEGIDSALVNFAGDVSVLGPHEDGSAWQVGIVDPRKPGTACDSVRMYRGAIATSGDYERFKIVDRHRYCHIINPRTGVPVQDILSVSVIAESCMVAGALSTIAMLSGREEAVGFLTRSGAPFLLLTADGRYESAWPGQRPAETSNFARV